MKRILSIVLAFCVAIGLAACGNTNENVHVQTTEGAAQSKPVEQQNACFQAGFAMVDITPKDSMPSGSSGNTHEHMSEGYYSRLEGRSVALKDADGQIMIFMTCDISWFPGHLSPQVRNKISKELGIEEDYIILSGTHTHASVDTSRTEMPVVTKYNDLFIKNMIQVAKDSVEDLKPAEVYVGSVMTENMNHVRRYFMDDGSLDGDNTYGTGTKRVAHETEADRELQIMKFVRESGKDIVITNFQAHPHLEGESNNLSAQTVGAIRDAVEEKLDARALHWQGAAGNVNTHGSLEGESPYPRSNAGRVAYGNAMGDYVVSVYDSLEKVNAGKIQVRMTVYEGKVNHNYDHLLSYASQIETYFASGQSPKAAATYAHELTASCDLRINSYYHAARITKNAALGASKEMKLYAWSFGDVGGVVLPYELFDTAGMQMKEQSPFERTFILGYSHPSYGGYIPTEEAFANGGYEADNSTFVPGTSEEMVECYLNMLNDMHE